MTPSARLVITVFTAAAVLLAIGCLFALAADQGPGRHKTTRWQHARDLAAWLHPPVLAGLAWDTREWARRTLTATVGWGRRARARKAAVARVRDLAPQRTGGPASNVRVIEPTPPLAPAPGDGPLYPDWRTGDFSRDMLNDMLAGGAA